MRVVATGVEQVTGTLSGGNQQKVLLAKWLIPTPQVLILDEPTRGIDVGAKAEIHRIVSHLAAQGMAIILISDDAQEVIGMADRILVFRSGRIAAEMNRATIRPGRSVARGRPGSRTGRGRRATSDEHGPAVAGGFGAGGEAIAAPSASQPAHARSRAQSRAGPRRHRRGHLLARASLPASRTTSSRLPFRRRWCASSRSARRSIIIARQIDLSVGAIVATSAFVSVEWLADNPDSPMMLSSS